jgi:type IV secretion system protein VirD4
MHSSYVVTDPKGTVLLEVGKALQKGVPKRDKKGNPVRDKNGKIIYEGGYDIKVLNTINFSKSMKYNPFAYIRSEKDILKLTNTIIANTKGDGDKSGEDFWVKAERLYYTALIGYIYYECEPHDRNMNSLINLINQSETREEDEEFMNAVDLMFESVEKGERLTSEEEMIDDEGDPVYGEDGNPIYEKILLYGENGEPLWLFRPRPDHFAVRQYKKFKLAAGKTTKSILISCGARLAPFDIQELRELTEYDELDLESLGTKKTALFVIISDTDDTFNFLVAIMYTQLFNILCDLADDKYGGRLPVHVRCILDEFANIGSIPKFEKLIATIRSREISACVILQAQSQLKAIYKDNADTIIGNCDSTLFLGGKEESTLKGLSEVLGKETIELYNTSRSRGGQESYGMNYQKLGRELMAKDEIAVMDGDKCIVQIRGTRPFFSNKYDLMKHPNITFTADANPKHTFDVDKHLRSRRKGIKDDMKVDENTVVEEIHDMRETA